MKHEFDDLWVVTVNWNQPEYTEQCILSLLNNDIPSSNIIIVDNGSKYDSITFFQDHLPNIKVISSKINLGFARGFNIGINYALEAGAESIFIVNNDTEIPAGMFRNFYSKSKLLRSDISSPAIFYAEEREKLWSSGGYFCKLFAAPINSHNRDKPIPQTPIKRDFLSGCALLINRHVFDSIGKFDDKFFLYYEDLDFLMRANVANFSCWLIPETKLFHYVSASSQGESSPAVYYWMSRSSWLYFRKHAHLWQWIFIIPWRLGHACKTILNFLFNNRSQNIIPYLTGFLMIKNEQFHRPLQNEIKKHDTRKF